VQITATLAAAALATTALAGGVAGAVVHAATATIRVECPASPPTPAGGDDMRQFMKRPAPPISGNPRY